MLQVLSCGIAGWPEEFLKNRPRCSPAHFLSKLVHSFLRGIKWPKIWDTVVIKKLPKETSYLTGENSSNPVTLVGFNFFSQFLPCVPARALPASLFLHMHCTCSCTQRERVGLALWNALAAIKRYYSERENEQKMFLFFKRYFRKHS
jgi:hypothetical protein